MKTCKLCKKQKKLIKKSHIVSDFLYKNLYDKNHKLYVFDPKEFLKKKPKIFKPSSGNYDKEILCNKCDSEIISSYENYAARLLNGKLTNNNKPKCNYSYPLGGLKTLKFSKLDYSQLKLFLLSLLWRADISKREEFQDVSLGPYSEKIRKQLLNNDPGNDKDIIISIIKLDSKAGFSSFIGQPVRYKIENTTGYSIIINGYLIAFHLKENSISKKILNHRLKLDGSMTILELPKEKVASFVMNYTGLTKK